MRYFPQVAPEFIHKLFKYRKCLFKVSSEALNNKGEVSYTFLSCKDNTDYMEYLFMFKLIVPVSMNIHLLKAANKKLI